MASTTLNMPHPYEDGMAEAWMETHVPEWEAGKRLTLAVTTQEEGLLGGVSLHLTAAHRRGEIGYWIAVPYWNCGYATEATRALIDYGFDELGLNRVVGRHITRNPASGRVMEKAGMALEGVMRQHILKWGELEDVAMYAILREDETGA